MPRYSVTEIRCIGGEFNRLTAHTQMCLGAVIQTGAIDRRETGWNGAFPTAISHQTKFVPLLMSFSEGLSGSVHLPATPLFRSWILFIVVNVVEELRSIDVSQIAQYVEISWCQGEWSPERHIHGRIISILCATSISTRIYYQAWSKWQRSESIPCRLMRQVGTSQGHQLVAPANQRPRGTPHRF